jgi:hypothetical protein
MQKLTSSSTCYEQPAEDLTLFEPWSQTQLKGHYDQEQIFGFIRCRSWQHSFDQPWAHPHCDYGQQPYQQKELRQWPNQHKSECTFVGLHIEKLTASTSKRLQTFYCLWMFKHGEVYCVSLQLMLGSDQAIRHTYMCT